MFYNEWEKQIETLELRRGNLEDVPEGWVRAVRMHNGMIFSISDIYIGDVYYEYEDDVIYTVEKTLVFNEELDMMVDEWKRIDDGIPTSKFNQYIQYIVELRGKYNV